MFLKTLQKESVSLLNECRAKRDLQSKTHIQLVEEARKM